LPARLRGGNSAAWPDLEGDMAKWAIKLGVDELNALMLEAFPESEPAPGPVVRVQPGLIQVVRRYHPSMQRPGDLVSGPVLMGLADMAAYVAILAHVGPELMAVTTSLTINFLRGAKVGDVHAEAQLLSLGRRLAVCDVRLWTESPHRLAAQATVTYARAGGAGV
jgi:uncharacterized protein (TIGR00369 family)